MVSLTGVSGAVSTGSVGGEAQAKVVKGALEQEEKVVSTLLSSIDQPQPRSPAQPTGQNLDLKA